ncbi:hypothetical protein B0A52_10005 [Exophiala mesophila]|uniref:HCNGP-like protein n=1 Tax=Exophiala mesophila TaxID=212818 RepID=A0A438MS56_EXOME|nr:hypothetical protein B0A52_10005 [Exophiala mesophila]
MSALVGYDSSSGDEDETQPTKPQRLPRPTQAKEIVPTPTAVSAHHREAPSQAHVSISEPDSSVAPVMGPALPPPNIDNTDIEGTPSRKPIDGYSERDAIRYLTQPSNPMTSLPDSPPGSPNPPVEAKFRKFLDLKAKGVHFNEDLGRKSTFRNPSLLSTLMDRAGLNGDDQYKSSVPTSIWDPVHIPPYAFKEELLRTQQTLREQQLATKKALSSAGKRRIDFTSANS